MPLNLYSNFLKNGIPETWTDTKTMQNMYPYDLKNWQVPVAHKETEFGIGVFSVERVTKGTVLRIGVDKENVIIAKGVNDLPEMYGSSDVNETKTNNQRRNSKC